MVNDPVGRRARSVMRCRAKSAGLVARGAPEPQGHHRAAAARFGVTADGGSGTDTLAIDSSVVFYSDYPYGIGGRQGPFNSSILFVPDAWYGQFIQIGDDDAEDLPSFDIGWSDFERFEFSGNNPLVFDGRVAGEPPERDLALTVLIRPWRVSA